MQVCELLCRPLIDLIDIAVVLVQSLLEFIKFTPNTLILRQIELKLNELLVCGVLVFFYNLHIVQSALDPKAKK